ncbi:MAG: hypothetical protein FVQ83_08830 [Chloroflexi bacterium]|nr:hypothetical protein [Chloroflexota bacterium]
MVSKYKSNIIRIFIALSALEGLFSLWWLLNIDQDPKNAWLFGYSIRRVGMILGLVIGVLFFIFLGWRVWHRSDLREKIIKIFEYISNNDLTFLTSITILNFSLIGLHYTFLNLINSFSYLKAGFSRILPIIIWFELIFLQFVLSLIILRQRREKINIHSKVEVLKVAGLAFGVFSFFGVFIAITKIGLEPIGEWENLGAPLLPSQVFFSLAIAWVLGLGWMILKRYKMFITFENFREILLVLFLWGFAVGLWQSVPIDRNFFMISPTIPNQEYYPNSDALLYDSIAQNYLVGEGFEPSEDNEKPLYSFMLAIFHAIGGPTYEAVVNLQIVLLALFPVVIYFIGKIMRHHFTGLMLATMVILREYNSLRLNGRIDVSHSKLLMTDMLSMLLLALFLGVTIFWLDRKCKSRKLALLSGGLLGLLALVRTQNLIFLGVVFFCLMVVLSFDKKKLFEIGFVFTFGTISVITPWVARNYNSIGSAFAIMPSKGRLIPARFYFPSGLAIPPQEDISFEDGMAVLFEFAKEHPREVAELITAHFFHNEVSTLFILPVNYEFQNCCELNMVGNLPYWQDDWNGYFGNQSWLPLLFNIVVISIGVGVAWQSKKVVGLLPLLVHLVFNLGTVIWGVSGWRFIMPVDWIGLLYYCIGFSYLIYIIFKFFNISVWESGDYEGEIEKKRAEVKINDRLILGSIALIFSIGLIMPLSESFIPPKYSEITKEEVLELISERLPILNELTNIDLDDLVNNSAVEVFSGRALYPHYNPAGNKPLSSNPAWNWSPSDLIDKDRMVFYLVGPYNLSVILPVDQIPEFFPNAEDVIVIGCQKDDYLLAQVVIFMNYPENTYISSMSCQ